MRRANRYRSWAKPVATPPEAPPTAPTIEMNGITLFCHGLLSHPQNWNPRPLSLLSVGGPREAVKGVLASAMTGHELTFSKAPADPAWGYDPHFRTHYGNQNQYHTLSRRLPSGQVHGLLFSANALPTETGSHFTLLVPQRESQHAPIRLLEAIDRRSELPLHPSWASWLWDTAITAEWLSPLIGFGPWIGWHVSYDEPALAEAVSEALRTQSVTVPLPTPDTAATVPLHTMSRINS